MKSSAEYSGADMVEETGTVWAVDVKRRMDGWVSHGFDCSVLVIHRSHACSRLNPEGHMYDSSETHFLISTVVVDSRSVAALRESD